MKTMAEATVDVFAEFQKPNAGRYAELSQSVNSEPVVLRAVIGIMGHSGGIGEKMVMAIAAGICIGIEMERPA